MSPVPPPSTDTSGPNYQNGLFSRVVGIHFPKKAPIIVGSLFCGGTSNEDGTHYAGVMGTSADGAAFQVTQPDWGGGIGGCGVAALGVKRTIVAAGYKISVYTIPTSGGPISRALNMAAALISLDGGQSWQDGGLPAEDPSWVITPDTIGYAFGAAQAVAYDPVGKAFYVTSVFYDGTGSLPQFRQKVFRGALGAGGSVGGWQAVDAQTLTVDDAQSGFPLPPWPSGSYVNDANVVINTSGQLVARINSNVVYLSSNAPGQVVRQGDQTIAITNADNPEFLSGTLDQLGNTITVDTSGVVSSSLGATYTIPGIFADIGHYFAAGGAANSGYLPCTVAAGVPVP